MRITSKGQVTIPADVRERHGLLPHTEVEFVTRGRDVILRKVKGKLDRGRLIVETLRGTATSGLSTEDIMSLTRGE